MIIFYIVIGLFWGTFALTQQIRLYGKDIDKIVICGILNFILWPVALLILLSQNIKNYIGD